MKSLKELREQRNMSQVELSQRAGCSPTTILRIEKWGHRPRVEVCQRIVTALGVNVTDVWGEGAGDGR